VRDKMYKKIFLTTFTGLSLLFLLSSCSTQNEVPNINSNKVYVDNGIFPLLKMENNKFNASANHMAMSLESVSTDDGIRMLLNHQTDIFVSTRNINTAEFRKMINQNVSIWNVVICNDGIAVITGSKSGINKITTDELSAALTCGKQSLNVYLPPKNSGTFNLIERRLTGGKLPVNGIITSSEEEIMQKVKADPYAVGLISSNLVNGRTDFKILPVGVLRYDFKAYYYLPDKQTLGWNYPLFRPIYILANFPQRPSAFEFSKFLVSTKAKSIIANDNLFPSYKTVRSQQL
jgi:ABC-type phosphate transport system substrate-binding protein